MAYHQYKFPLDPYTQKILARFDCDEWNDLLRVVLSGKSVDYNIEFSDQDVITRLFELYDLVGTYGLDEQVFQQGLVQLFIEYYGNSNKIKESLLLIQTIDYVKPSRYFKQLLNIATDPQHDRMVKATSPDGLSIHLYLINALIKFDLLGRDKVLLKYLLKKKDASMPPEYYQVTIRYLYRLDNEVEFNLFMNDIFDRLHNQEIVRFVLIAIREYFFYKESFSLLYGWLIKNFRTLRQYMWYGDFVVQVFSLLDSQAGQHKDKIMFSSLFAFLAPRENQVWLTLVHKILVEQEFHSLQEKEVFFYYLGYRHPELQYIELKEEDGAINACFFYDYEDLLRSDEKNSMLYVQLYYGLNKAKKKSMSGGDIKKLLAVARN